MTRSPVGAALASRKTRTKPPDGLPLVPPAPSALTNQWMRGPKEADAVSPRKTRNIQRGVFPRIGPEADPEAAAVAIEDGFEAGHRAA